MNFYFLLPLTDCLAMPSALCCALSLVSCLLVVIDLVSGRLGLSVPEAGGLKLHLSLLTPLLDCP